MGMLRYGIFRRFHSKLTRSGPLKELREFMSDPKLSNSIASEEAVKEPPYLNRMQDQKIRKVFIETYGCQMNFNDTEIVLRILNSSGFGRSESLDDADAVLLMTCAIRENAEDKIWRRLEFIHSVEAKSKKRMVVGILGCMAERLKQKLLEKDKNVDLICGPDSYRDLPNLLRSAEEGHISANVLLSADETYADIKPVRVDASQKSAFLSIMRGCNNMCAFCIVPFTRGRERSRPVQSIIDEAKYLADEGVKEITLLGQNVNSYRDETDYGPLPFGNVNYIGGMSEGFKTIYKPRSGGLTFAFLLDKLSASLPQVRFRFTSPHPKDFPGDLLYLMAERSNICKNVHLPAQSGSSLVLERMRRGYDKESYLRLVETIRSIIPGVALSSDFIVGFCGESEADHLETLDLMRRVDYDMAYMFAYSMREKTFAHRHYQDDVPENIKQRRLRELIDLFYRGLKERVLKSVGSEELILVDGVSKKDPGMLCGKSDGNRTIVFDPIPVPCMRSNTIKIPEIGDFLRVKVDRIAGTTPIAVPLAIEDL